MATMKGRSTRNQITFSTILFFKVTVHVNCYYVKYTIWSICDDSVIPFQGAKTYIVWGQNCVL
jgi:hypothetical protein